MAFSDLLALADTRIRAELGESVVYTPGVGSAVTVSGVFDAVYQFVEAGTNGVSSSAPAVFLRLEDLPTNPCDDLDATITVASIDYRIFEAKPDGLGAVLIRLLET